MVKSLIQGDTVSGKPRVKPRKFNCAFNTMLM